MGFATCFLVNFAGILLMMGCFLDQLGLSLMIAPIMRADYFPVNSSDIVDG